jgi:hypothetical protein
MKTHFKNLLLHLTPLFHCILLVAVALFFVIAPTALVLFNADVLGYFWIPILLSYCTLLVVVTWQLYRRFELLEERPHFTEEEFYARYPHLKRMEERKKRRLALWSALVSKLK